MWIFISYESPFQLTKTQTENVPVKNNLVSSGLKMPHIWINSKFKLPVRVDFPLQWHLLCLLLGLPLVAGHWSFSKKQEDKSPVSMFSSESWPIFIKMAVLKCTEVWQLLVFWGNMPLTISFQPILHLIYLCPQGFHILSMGQVGTSWSLVATL